MSNNKFNFLIDKIKFGLPGAKETKLYITPNDFNYMSAFERNSLKTIGNMQGALNNPDKDFTYEDLVKVFQKLTSHKSDSERTYIYSLFFPEKIKTGQVMLPFPIPTYTYVQKLQFYLTPNSNGAFLLQMTSVRIYQ